MKILIFLFLFNINYLTCIKLTIKEADSNNKYVTERDRLLSLSCESDSISQKETIQWYLPSSPNAPTENKDSTQKVSVKDEYVGNRRILILNIRDVSTDSSGRYSCRSYQYEGSSQQLLAEVFVNVDIYKPITIVGCEPEQYLQLNSTSSLRCEIDSDPKALVFWELNGKKLGQEAKYKLTPTDLTISNVTTLDAGHYVFTAHQINFQSSLIRDILVRTYELPRITVGPRILRPISNGIIEGWYGDIQCLAEGNPTPTVNWFRKKYGTEELQIVNPQRYFVNTNPKVGTLRISIPTYPDDNDDYICKAMLPYFMVSNVPSITFDSRTIPISVSIYPMFTQVDRMTVLIDAGKTAIIQCRVRTTDPVKLVWQKFNSNTPYQYGVQPSDPRITVSVSKEPLDPIYQVLRLEIKDVKFSDSYNYTCIATNPGFNASYNGTIMVRQKPSLSNNTATTVFGWLFNATNLTCSSEGFPHPRWNWYRDRFSVENDINSTFRIISWDYETHSVSWLQIIPDLSNQYWIYDHYECQALNEAGQSRKYLKFVQSSIPSQPQVLFLNRTSSSLIFSIAPPLINGGLIILHYEVVYRALTGSTAFYGPVFYQPDETVIRITGLVHDTNYRVAFYACNEVGRSMDITLDDRTTSASVPYPVKLIRRQRSTYPYGYNVQWEVPPDGGYPILGYRITLRPMGPSPAAPANSTPAFLAMSPSLIVPAGTVRVYEPLLTNPYTSIFRLDDLDSSTVYEVAIAARNQLGLSNFTSMLFYTPIGDSLGRPPRVRGNQERPVVLGTVVMVAVIIAILCGTV